MAQTAVPPPAGDRTFDDPYEIVSLENLYWIVVSDDVVYNPNQAVDGQVTIFRQKT
ncbi:MAG: hypothetical protein K0B81_09020 [Candidatus Cloacimonetes bacterium]|nr:hypothetical protein [Candidatus Cloacimonadota bacterium]